MFALASLVRSFARFPFSASRCFPSLRYYEANKVFPISRVPGCVLTPTGESRSPPRSSKPRCSFVRSNFQKWDVISPLRKNAFNFRLPRSSTFQKLPPPLNDYINRFRKVTRSRARSRSIGSIVVEGKLEFLYRIRDKKERGDRKRSVPLSSRIKAL